eukprot:TCONS_00059604-protein
MIGESLGSINKKIYQSIKNARKMLDVSIKVANKRFDESINDAKMKFEESIASSKHILETSVNIAKQALEESINEAKLHLVEKSDQNSLSDTIKEEIIDDETTSECTVDCAIRLIDYDSSDSENIDDLQSQQTPMDTEERSSKKTSKSKPKNKDDLLNLNVDSKSGQQTAKETTKGPRGSTKKAIASIQKDSDINNSHLNVDSVCCQQTIDMTDQTENEISLSDQSATPTSKDLSKKLTKTNSKASNDTFSPPNHLPNSDANPQEGKVRTHFTGQQSNGVVRHEIANDSNESTRNIHRASNEFFSASFCPPYQTHQHHGNHRFHGPFNARAGLPNNGFRMMRWIPSDNHMRIHSPRIINHYSEDGLLPAPGEELYPDDGLLPHPSPGWGLLPQPQFLLRAHPPMRLFHPPQTVLNSNVSNGRDLPSVHDNSVMEQEYIGSCVQSPENHTGPIVEALINETSSVEVRGEPSNNALRQEEHLSGMGHTKGNAQKQNVTQQQGATKKFKRYRHDTRKIKKLLTNAKEQKKIEKELRKALEIATSMNKESGS